MSNLTDNASGTSIGAVSVHVADDVAQRAADCTILLAAVGEFAPPLAEFSVPGDTETFTSTTLRPTGAILSVHASYAGIPFHSIFTGVIEFMDDVADSSKDMWTIKLSAVPRNQPNRIPVTQIFNHFFTDQIGTGKSSDILATVATTAGLKIGRNDLPDYNVVGTYEVIHKTVVALAEALAQPFDMFDFQKYYVRTDSQGLQVIKIDYSADPGGGVYEIPNVISYERHFEVYMPESRVGDGDILLTGGDLMVPVGGPTTTSFAATVTKTFTSSTQDTQSIAQFEKWAVRNVTMQFLCEWNGADLSGSVDLDTLVAAAKSGTITDLKLTESFTLKDETFEYDSINGLVRSTHTFFTYADKTFHDNTYLSFTVTKKVILQDETQEYIYPRGVKFNKSLNRRVYNYNQIGVQTSVATYEYFGLRDQWNLNDVKIDQGDVVGATNAEIQFYTANKKALDSAPVQAAVGTNGITGRITTNTKTQVGKYQLFNGGPLPVLSQDLLNHPFDQNLNFAVREFQIHSAFQISCPNMDFTGLLLVWALILRQRFLEQNNAYWQIVKVKCSIDTVPAVGTSVRAAGFYGFVTAFEHDIDQNEALTSVTIKRLLIPGGS